MGYCWEGTTSTAAPPSSGSDSQHTRAILLEQQLYITSDKASFIQSLGLHVFKIGWFPDEFFKGLPNVHHYPEISVFTVEWGGWSLNPSMYNRVLVGVKYTY